MRTARILLAALVAAAFFPARAAHAQGSRDVVIHLRRAGDTVSIRGAAVTIDHTIDLNADANGNVKIADFEDGGHIIEVVARGYQAFFDNFKTGENIAMPIVLDVLPVIVDTTKGRGEKTALTFAGFNARRAKGQGKFFTKAQLDKASGRPLASFLKTDAGAFFEAGPKGESQLAMKGAASTCLTAVVRDGVRIYPFPGATPPDFDKTFPEELAGIEFYAKPATVPADLKAVNKCGALVLWTRDVR